MKLTRLHTAAVTGLAAVALTAGSLAIPTKAEAIEPVTGAIIGGAIVGGVIAGSHHHHRNRVVIHESSPSVVVQDCFYVTQRVYDEDEGDYDYRKVRVCD